MKASASTVRPLDVRRVVLPGIQAAAFWALAYLDPNVEACVDHFHTDTDTRSHFIAAWGHVAARLKDQGSVVGFDILNEPPWGTYPSAPSKQEPPTAAL